MEGIRRNTHRYTDNVKQQTIDLYRTRYPIFSFNTKFTGVSQTPVIPNEDPTDIENRDLRKRQKYIQRCKEAVWKRWRYEYLTSLLERHNLKHNKRESEVKGGEEDGIITDILEEMAK